MRHLQMEVNHVNPTKGIPGDSDQTQTALGWHERTPDDALKRETEFFFARVHCQAHA